MDKNLSVEQRSYFKNSKVRDEQGNLLNRYHGSGTKIEEFKPSFTGQGADQYGSGFYFTSSKEGAECYTTTRNKDMSGNEIEKLGGEDNPSVVEAYINIENPILCDGYVQPDLSHVLVPNELVYDIIKTLPTLYHTMEDENEPNPLTDYSERFWEVDIQTPEEFEPLIKEMVKKHFQNTDLKDLDIFFGKYGTNLRQAIRDTMGYDGVIVNFESNHFLENGQVVVAWFPEQIKDVNNLFPQRTSKLMDEKPLAMTKDNEEFIEDEWVMEM